ncbi:MAG: BlaI/MecI/CopY family transcriptional regulator [Ruminococcaceae bacterium]|jgi:BlaI family penicillinase repressor|nr:BlaI/MecI/CopY family transcriptional regulator [Oscillospiraceae bacterium]
MNKLSLSDGEWKLMNLLWDEQPLTIGRIVEALKDDTAWTKATVNIMLGRLADKGAVRVDASGPRKLFYPLLARDDAVQQEARNTLSKIKTGGLGLLISTMTRESELTDAEIDELYRILKEGLDRHD